MKSKSLLEELNEYARKKRYPLHMPGHKRNKKFLEGGDIYDIDITEIEGFDNLHCATDILKVAMERARNFYGTKRTWFLVNGSTCGILAAVSAVTRAGDKILIGRNCHQSVYHAVELQNLDVEYIYPEYIKEYGIDGGYSPEKIKRILENNPEIRVVVLTSPTYEGIISDINRISEIIHQKGGILIIDEAHGAHFRLYGEIIRPAYAQGADIVIESLHKTLSAMTQTALLHLTGERVREEMIEKYLGFYETSSPSYIMMASIDSCIGEIRQSGNIRMKQLLVQLQKLKKQAKQWKYLRILGEDVIGENFVFNVDETKVLIDVRNTGITGVDFARILREKYNFEMEMGTKTHILAICSICDDLKQLERFFDSLEEMDANCIQREKLSKESCKKHRRIYSIGDTERKNQEQIKIIDAANRVAAEYLYAYPPGIPIIIPGELIDESTIKKILEIKNCGQMITGLRDKNSDLIDVVKE